MQTHFTHTHAHVLIAKLHSFILFVMW